MRPALRHVLPALLSLLIPQLTRASLPLTPDWTLESDRQGHGMGWSLHTAGDVNGDGYSDVLVGAQGAVTGSAAAYLYLGGATGSPFQPSRLAWQKLNFSVQAYVSAAGDVNGDGYGDVAVAWGTTFRVYYGNSSGLDTTNFFFQNHFSPQGFYFLRTAPAGDVNGDGYDDVLFSNSEFGGSFSPCNNNWTGQVILFYGSASGLNALSSWTACGNGTFTRLGAGIGGAGDINGDGFDDFVMGSPGEGSEGRARVMFGSGSGPTFGPNLAGDQAGMSFGASVGGAGDVNGDGFADVIVGGPARDYTGANNAGSAYVYAGNSGGINTTPLWFEWGPSADDQFGSTVGTAGDLDGDGYAEIVVGAPFYSNGQGSEGQVAVWYGSNIGPLPTSWFPESNGPGALMAAAVCAGGDIDGDGLGELIVGLPGWANPTLNEGAVWVYRGRGELPDKNHPNTTWMGEQNTGYLGWSVSRAGDFNADGYDDVVVGEPLWDGANVDAGRLLLYLGTSTGLPATPTAWAEGVNNSDRGIAVTCVGDVNGDGYSDVAVGSHVLGVVDIYYGNASGNLSGGSTEVWGTFQPSEYFGGAVGGGDINGDGYGDLIVGAPGWDGPMGADQGRVYVYFSSGPSGIAVGATPTQIIEASQIGENFGSAVAYAGDLNRDGRGDVVIGAELYNQPSPIIGAPPLNDAGRFSVRLGTPTGLSAQVFGGAGDADDAHLGARAAPAGDFDNDGYADAIVGAYGYLGLGMFRVLFGGPSGIGFFTQVDGTQGFAGFGSSVDAAGDVNGDGFGDLLVGAVFFNGLANDDGRMSLYLGNSGRTFTESWFKDGGQDFANLGHSIAGIGDVNADGFDDVAGGAPGYDPNFLIPQAGYVQTFLGNSGGGLSHQLIAVRAGGNAAIEGGLTNNPNQYGLIGIGRSAAGRTKVRMEWINERADGAAGALRGVGNWVATNASSGTGSTVLVIQPGVGGLTANTSYGWRARFRSRSLYIPATSWTTPGTNGRKIADLRTGPALVAVDPVAVAEGTLDFASPRPNPFRGELALEFSLPRSGEARIDVTDLQGRHVRRLARGTLDAGRHRLAWDGHDERGAGVAAGIYFITVDALGERRTQRVVRLP